MSEYIVDVGNAVEEYIEYFGHMAKTYADNPIRELIVRCMDCKHFSYGSDNGTGSDWCDFHEHIAWSHLGFCSWAERREQ